MMYDDFQTKYTEQEISMVLHYQYSPVTFQVKSYQTAAITQV